MKLPPWLLPSFGAALFAIIVGALNMWADVREIRRTNADLRNRIDTYQDRNSSVMIDLLKRSHEHGPVYAPQRTPWEQKEGSEP